MGGTTKSTTTLRRVPSSLSKVSTPPSTTRPVKNPKQSNVIKLKLPPTKLSRFPHEKPTRKASQTKTPPAPLPATPLASDKAKPLPTKAEPKTPPASIRSDIPETPIDNMNQQAPTGTVIGVKRELGEGVDDSAKSKARPGPKKRQKMDNGVADSNHTGKPVSGAAIGPTHKLGPKANQGAINAGLRALDRTGTPCRKWNKSGFCVKTFTGVTWQVSSWRAPRTGKTEAEDDTVQPSLPNSNSQSKENNSSSIVGSEKSQTNNAATAANSPLPSIPVPA